jgi:nucleoside-diphosphate-sugar epimerase
MADLAVSGLTGRRVLVPGGLGFLGLNLIPLLLDRGARVRVLNRSLDPLAVRWLSLATGGRPVELLQGDITDPCMPEWLEGIDLVINLAGESGAAKSLSEAQADMQVNIAGHLNLLNAARAQARPPRMVFLSSRLVYGVTGGAPVGEDHPTRPTSLYGLHKLTVEHYHRIFWEHDGLPFTVLRVTNPYGPYQLPHGRHHGIVNRFIMEALAGGTLRLFGGGGQLRDYIHVSDLAEAILRISTSERAVGETLNLGSGIPVSLAEVARRILAAAGSGRIEDVHWPENDRKVETGDFLCETRRIETLLGWRAEIPLEEGLGRTVEAYRRLMR